jgi:hypothetical protein
MYKKTYIDFLGTFLAASLCLLKQKNRNGILLMTVVANHSAPRNIVANHSAPRNIVANHPAPSALTIQLESLEWNQPGHNP